jgi:hypothetical protein
MQKEHPILFSSPMVQAILAGRKSMTRRTTGLDEVNENPNDWKFTGMYIQGANTDKPMLLASFQSLVSESDVKFIKCPYADFVGDLLWVRETFCKVADGHFLYKANPEHQSMRWKPSIHMPKAAARIWLEITNVRVERLQDITEADAVAEGIEESDFDTVNNCRVFKHYGYQNAVTDELDSFKSLWHSINDEESWNANPWVWVIEFKRVNHE